MSQIEHKEELHKQTSTSSAAERKLLNKNNGKEKE